MFKAIGTGLVAGALLLAGCSGGGGQPTAQATQRAGSPVVQPSQAPGGKLNAPIVSPLGQNLTIPGASGQNVTVSSGTPNELKDFPVPPGFAYDSGGTMSASGRDGGSLAVAAWKGKMTLADGISYYKGLATQKGWKETLSMTNADGGQLLYSTASNYNYIVTFSVEDGGVLQVSVLGSQAPSATPTPAGQGAAATATRPAVNATAAPVVTVPVAQMPQELQAFPLPNGFAPKKDGMVRMVSGNQLQMAVAVLVGTGDPGQIAKFYQGALPSKGWTEELMMSTGQGVMLSFVGQVSGADFALNVSIEKKDAGTEVFLTLMPQ